MKGPIRSDTDNSNILEAVLNSQVSNSKKGEMVFDSGLNGVRVEEEARKIIEKLYADAFSKGIPMYYRDVRTKGTKHFIRANPDGSEDFVSFSLPEREYVLIKNLFPSGNGYWSCVLNA